MIVLAVIVAVIAALLFIPIKIVISFRGTLALWVKVLFLRFKLMPRRKKPEKVPEKPKEAPPEKPKEEPVERPEKPKESTEEKPKERPAPKPEKKPEKSAEAEQSKTAESEQSKTAEADEETAEEELGFVDRFLHYYNIAAQFLDPFRRALRRIIRIDELNVNVRVGTPDAADTAVYTGMTWAIAGNLLGLVARFVTIKKRNITVSPAFNESVLSAEGDCIIHTNIANIIGAAAIAAFAYLKYRIINRRNKK